MRHQIETIFIAHIDNTLHMFYGRKRILPVPQKNIHSNFQSPLELVKLFCIVNKRFFYSCAALRVFANDFLNTFYQIHFPFEIYISCSSTSRMHAHAFNLTSSPSRLQLVEVCLCATKIIATFFFEV